MNQPGRRRETDATYQEIIDAARLRPPQHREARCHALSSGGPRCQMMAKPRTDGRVLCPAHRRAKSVVMFDAATMEVEP